MGLAGRRLWGAPMSVSSILARSWQRLDPRLHLASAVGWSVFALVMLAALAAAKLAAGEAELRARLDAEQLLGQFAIQIRHALTLNLATRQSIMLATAAQIVASNDRGDDALRRHLEAVQVQFPEFAWLGVVDDSGHITAATGGLLEKQVVIALRWFQQGRERLLVGEVHTIQSLQDLLPPAVDGKPMRFIDIAVPLAHGGESKVGVLGAELSWDWIERLQAELLRGLDTRRKLDLILAAGDGTVLVGPPDWLGRPLPDATALAASGRFLVGRDSGDGREVNGQAWTVIVRQDAASALAPAQSTRQTVFVTVLLAGLVSAVLAVAITRWLLRRLGRLAEQAQAVRRGERSALTLPAGHDEVSRIGATLAEVVDHLQHEKQALQTLNVELDARVVERTARIERLAEDARHAAVTRERLRLARDLHDTLAHSLMALLTQIRLVRKLRGRMPEPELESELARAEDVAATGLAEARAAITQMRQSGVRDTGLGPALQEALARFQERSGVAATLQADPRCAGLADERAETVFRIVEEALRNIERHARAKRVQLQLDWVVSTEADASVGGQPERVRLVITDDGVGFDATAPNPGHYGLAGIREQAALLDAQLDLSSRPGEGTRMVLEFNA